MEQSVSVPTAPLRIGGSEQAVDNDGGGASGGIVAAGPPPPADDIQTVFHEIGQY